jgi:hypothetical protein
VGKDFKMTVDTTEARLLLNLLAAAAKLQVSTMTRDVIVRLRGRITQGVASTTER